MITVNIQLCNIRLRCIWESRFALKLIAFFVEYKQFYTKINALNNNEIWTKHV